MAVYRMYQDKSPAQKSADHGRDEPLHLTRVSPRRTTARSSWAEDRGNGLLVVGIFPTDGFSAQSLPAPVRQGNLGGIATNRLVVSYM